MAVITIIDDVDKNYSYLVDNAQSPIGKGGMGTVYRGICVDSNNPDSRREVAIKFIHENLDNDIIERARREASISIYHENVLEMIAFVSMTVQTQNGVKTRYFVVSELVNGVSLLDLIKGKVTDIQGDEFEFAKSNLQKFRINRTKFVLDITRSVLRGLEAIHNAGYVHRDIDPSNIMLTREGKVKIIDFGITKKIDKSAKSEPNLTQAGMGMGKAVYSSPEVLSGEVEKHNASSDLYSVGIMMYALAVGVLPYSGTLTAILINKLTHPVPVENIKDKKIRSIVKKATETKQSKRYRSVSEFMSALYQEEHNDLWKIISAVAFAVIVGLLLGFLLIY